MTPRTARWFAMLAGVLLAVRPAGAGSDPSTLYAPSIDRARFDAFVLDLETRDAAAAKEARDLYRGLLDTLRTERDRAAATMRRIDAKREAWRKEHPDRDRWSMPADDFGSHELVAASRVHRCALEAAWEQSTGDVLAERDRPAWTALVRRSRRERLLGEVRQIGRTRHALDLVEVLAGLDLSALERLAIAPAQERYEGELDLALRRWDSESPVLRAQIMARRGDSTTFEGTRSTRRIQGRLDGLAADMASAITRHVSEIESALPAWIRSEFIWAVRREAYPSIAARSPVDLLATGIRELDSVPERQKARVAIVYREYRRASEELFREAAARIDERETRRKSASQKRRPPPPDDGVRGAEHPLIPTLYRRRQLAIEACRAIAAIFVEEELEALPPRLSSMLRWAHEVASGPGE